MANIRNAVLASDFSCKDTYCDSSSGENKLLDKITYHVSSGNYVGTDANDGNGNENQGNTIVNTDLNVNVDLNTVTMPLASSIPLGGDNNEVIIADNGIVKEIYNNCVIEWKANYTACDTITWDIVNIDLSDADPNAVDLNCAAITF